jgi:hypothetical protein
MFLKGPEKILHCKKKVNDFPVPSRDVALTKLSLAGNKKLFRPGRVWFGAM